MQQHEKLSKYLKGTAKALEVLADEIIAKGEFDKESEDLMCKIGSNLLFEAKVYYYKN